MSRDVDEGSSYFDWFEKLTGRKPAVAGYWASSDPCEDRYEDRCLFVDGFFSTSTTAEGWIESLRKKLHPESTGHLSVKGLSYYRPGWHYDREAINAPFADHISLFEEHMPSVRCTVIPIGFSHGSNVVISGSAKVLSSPSFPVTIPLVILVAPAHRVRNEVLAEFERAYARTDISDKDKRIIPISIVRLANLPSWQKRFIDDYSQMLSRKVHIHVIYSVDDLIVAESESLWSRQTSAFLHLDPITPAHKGDAAQRPTTAEEEVKYHLRFRSADEILGRIRSILLEFLSLDKHTYQ